MKIFVKSIQAWDQEQLELQKCLLKIKSPKTYFKKFYIDCYFFCQQYEDYFEILGGTKMNYTSFTVIFLRDIINPRWAQHKRRHQNATPIILSEFKIFL